MQQGKKRVVFSNYDTEEYERLAREGLAVK